MTTRITILIALIECIAAIVHPTYEPCLETNRKNSTKSYCEIKYRVENVTLDQLLRECENQGGDCSIVTRNGYRAIRLNVPRGNLTLLSLQRERGKRRLFCSGKVTLPNEATFFDDTEICLLLASPVKPIVAAGPEYEPCAMIDRPDSTKAYCHLKFWTRNVTLNHLLQDCQSLPKEAGNCSILTENGYDVLHIHVHEGNLTLASLLNDTVYKEERACNKHVIMSKTIHHDIDLCIVLDTYAVPGTNGTSSPQNDSWLEMFDIIFIVVLCLLIISLFFLGGLFVRACKLLARKQFDMFSLSRLRPNPTRGPRYVPSTGYEMPVPLYAEIDSKV